MTMTTNRSTGRTPTGRGNSTSFASPELTDAVDVTLLPEAPEPIYARFDGQQMTQDEAWALWCTRVGGGDLPWAELLTDTVWGASLAQNTSAVQRSADFLGVDLEAAGFGLPRVDEPTLSPSFALPSGVDRTWLEERLVEARSTRVHGNLLNSFTRHDNEVIARAAQANPKLSGKTMTLLFSEGGAHADVLLGRPDIQCVDEAIVREQVTSGREQDRLAAAQNLHMAPAVLKMLTNDRVEIVRLCAAESLVHSNF